MLVIGDLLVEDAVWRVCKNGGVSCVPVRASKKFVLYVIILVYKFKMYFAKSVIDFFCSWMYVMFCVEIQVAFIFSPVNIVDLAKGLALKSLSFLKTKF